MSKIVIKATPDNGRKSRKKTFLVRAKEVINLRSLVNFLTLPQIQTDYLEIAEKLTKLTGERQDPAGVRYIFNADNIKLSTFEKILCAFGYKMTFELREDMFPVKYKKGVPQDQQKHPYETLPEYEARMNGTKVKQSFGKWIPEKMSYIEQNNFLERGESRLDFLRRFMFEKKINQRKLSEILETSPASTGRILLKDDPSLSLLLGLCQRLSVVPYVLYAPFASTKEANEYTTLILSKTKREVKPRKKRNEDKKDENSSEEKNDLVSGEK